MSIDYTLLKLREAVLTLATGQNSIQDRLCNAYRCYLLFLNPNDFPEDLQNHFIKVQEDLTQVEPSGDEGSIAATTRAMSVEKADEITEMIVFIFEQVAYKYGLINQLDDLISRDDYENT